TGNGHRPPPLASTAWFPSAVVWVPGARSSALRRYQTLTASRRNYERTAVTRVGTKPRAQSTEPLMSPDPGLRSSTISTASKTSRISSARSGCLAQYSWMAGPSPRLQRARNLSARSSTGLRSTLAEDSALLPVLIEEPRSGLEDVAQ